MEIKIRDKDKNSIVEAKQIAKILTAILKASDKLDQDKEHLWGVYLDNRNVIKRIDLIALGTLNATIIHPREMLRPAIQCASSTFCVAHNHPSNNADPSEADKIAMGRIKEAGKLMGIQLLDAIIIDGKGKFFSFKEEGLI